GEVEDAADVGVLELAGVAELAAQALDPALVGGQVGPQDFHGDDGADHPVEGLQDRAGGAAADAFLDLVAATEEIAAAELDHVGAEQELPPAGRQLTRRLAALRSRLRTVLV